MSKERTASFYIGDDQWHCTTYPVSEVTKITRKTEFLIRRAFDAWKGSQDGKLPLLAGFDPKKILRKEESGRISHIDTEDEPKQFKLLRLGIGETVVRPLAITNPFHRHGVIMEILECKETQQPIFQEVRITIGGKETHKRRLLLPFANEHGNVAAVISVCCLVTAEARRSIDFAAMLP